MFAVIPKLRKAFQQKAFSELIRIDNDTVNFADTASKISKEFSSGIVKSFECEILPGKLSGQAAGKTFESLVLDFVREAFAALFHLRPGKWGVSGGTSLAEFEQYAHLINLKAATEKNPQLSVILGGDYLIKPDIVVFRSPESDEVINRHGNVVNDQSARLTVMREANGGKKILHASISCKWTIRSDRSQNSRTEKCVGACVTAFERIPGFCEKQ
jgi:hypothetical protein